MAKLQIKSLTSPSEMQQNQQSGVASYGIILLNNDTLETNSVFTCKFHRDIVVTDYTNQIITVEIKIYTVDINNNIAANPIRTFSQNLRSTHIITDNSFKFQLTIPTTVTGNHFYVHAVKVNTGENVSIGVSKYHETIKQVNVYSEKQITHTYWSSEEIITTTDTEEDVFYLAASQEDAFIHIKATGMYNDQVQVTLTNNDTNQQIRAPFTVTLNQNKKVIAIRLSELSISFPVKIKVQANSLSNTEDFWNTIGRIVEFSPVALFMRYIGALFGEDSETSIETVDLPSDVLEVEEGGKHFPCKMTSTGTVYVNVGNNNTPTNIETPTEYTDFTIGYIVHVEGVGKLVNRNDNDSTNRQERTVYPFHIYEYLLSDLVIIEAITIEDAILIAPPPSLQTDDARRGQRTQLEESFNKFTKRISDNTLLIDKFRDASNRNTTLRSRINGIFTRKLLTQAQTRNPIQVEDLDFFICRDAWQGSTSRRAGRYDSSQECPSGEYFLNYIPKTGLANNRDGTPKFDKLDKPVSAPMYRIGVSQVLVYSSIYSYPNAGATRTGIALHNGGSVASIGCITFNTGHNYDGNEHFINAIYKIQIGSYGARDDAALRDVNVDRKKINLLCADERNALQESGDRRYYDLIDRNRNVTP